MSLTEDMDSSLCERVAARYTATVAPGSTNVLGAIGTILANESDAQELGRTLKDPLTLRVLARVSSDAERVERKLESAEFMNGNGVQTISVLERVRPAHAPGDAPYHSYYLTTFADHFGLNVKTETSLNSWAAAAWLSEALRRTAISMKARQPDPMSDYIPDVRFENGAERTTARVLARFKGAMEHPSPEARRDYLHEHPHADPANHTVAKPGEHGGGHEEHHEEKPKKTWKERLQGMSEKAQAFVKSAPADLKKFFEDESHRRKVLMGAHEKLVKAPEKLMKNVLHTVKHEVKEFKEAGEGVAAVLKGGKMNDHQKKALKTVGFHLALTAVATVLTASGGPLAGAVVFGKSMAKHVAMKSVSNAMGHLHVLEEMGHVGHGIHHILDKLAADKADPEDVMAQFFIAAAAKELENLDMSGIQEALEGMGTADEEPADPKA